MPLESGYRQDTFSLCAYADEFKREQRNLRSRPLVQIDEQFRVNVGAP